MPTITCAAVMTDVFIGGSGSAAGNYNFVFRASISDGTTTTTFSVGFLAEVPLTITNFKKADQQVREAIAAAALTASSLTIDPEDIYIPFSN